MKAKLPRPQHRTRGLSLVELLIALVVLGIALIGFAFSQVGALRASTRSSLVTEAKAAANRVLEEKTTEVLQVTRLADTNQYCDQADPGTGQCNSFFFHDFYYRCPPLPTGATVTSGRTQLRTAQELGGCRGDVSAGASSNGAALGGIDAMTIAWMVAGRNGIDGEGIMDIVVTAQADGGGIVTVGTTITCYDIFPAPTKNAPEPCPETPSSGTAGGR